VFEKNPPFTSVLNRVTLTTESHLISPSSIFILPSESVGPSSNLSPPLMLRPKCICYFLLIYSSMDLVNLILNSRSVPPLWNRWAALHCTIHAILEQCVALYIVWSVYHPNCFHEINIISSYFAERRCYYRGPYSAD